jgi:hypothetical protein
MNPGALLTVALWLFSLLPQSAPRDSTPPRNSFVVAAESAIDNATAVNLKGDDAQFGSQIQALKSSQANLTRMAENDNERDVASDVNDLVFAVSACHIQAKGGAPTPQCESQISDARTRAMQALNKHKSGSIWQDGPSA